MSHIAQQKMIARNTFFLYLRMFIVMAVSLYTSRVILDKLGVEDFGIYNIVGSIVISFVFVQNSLMASTQRFFSFSHGRGDENCSKLFSMSINIHLLYALVIVLLLETIGLYFLYNIINIPEERLQEAVIVYHISVITFCLNLLKIPYSSLIVSRERMSIYAYYSVFDVLLKLAIVYVLNLEIQIDRLVLYALLMFLVTLIGNAYVVIYCMKKLRQDCQYRKNLDLPLFKEMNSFATWNLAGGITSIASTDGPNYFMNYYLGVTVNAGMGIAKQVSNAIYTFSANFQTAFNPQIIKSYASKDFAYLYNLVFRTSKLSFYLIFVVGLPIIICIDDVLDIWLTVVPPYAGIFSVCMLFSQIVAALSAPLWMLAHAIGDIKRYQLALCLFNVIIIPVAWIILSLNCEPYWILIVQVFVNIGVLLYRLIYLKGRTGFPIGQFIRSVIVKVFLLIPVLSVPILYLSTMGFSGLLKIFISTILSTIVITALFMACGLNSVERVFVINMVRNRFIKR